MALVRRAIAPCPNCGETIWSEQSDKLCPRCRRPLPDNITAEFQWVQQPACVNCGGSVPKTSRFCPKCGSPTPANKVDEGFQVPHAANAYEKESREPGVTPRKEEGRLPMPKFCSNCATALDLDAKFCPSCRVPVSYSAVVASEIRAGIHAGVRSVIQSPSLKVAPPIWAGVIEVFWVLLSVGMALGTVLLSAAGGVAGMLSRSADAERALFFMLLLGFSYLGQLSFELPLVFGFFAQKRWAYGLYLWSIVPLTLFRPLLGLGASMLGGKSDSTAKDTPLSFAMLVVLGLIFGLGLLVLQVILVRKSKDHLVN